MTTPIRVAVTGAGGQIGYALIVPDRLRRAVSAPISRSRLQLLEITPALPSLERHLDGARRLRFPAPDRRQGDRQGRGSL